jgi:long-chain acyl-CoA synthetase
MNNLAELLQRRLANPDRPLYTQYLDGAWRDFTAAEVVELSARWQQAFLREGLVAGDRVALCLRNGVNWVAVDQAALGLGLVVVPLYVDDNAENIAWCLIDSGARLLVMDSTRLLVALQQALPDMPVVVCFQENPPAPAVPVREWLPAAAGPFEVAPVEAATLATLVYTSGTTGRPKGVMLTHGNILSNLEAVSRTIEADDRDRFLSLLPLSHMLERTGGYLFPLYCGAGVAFSRGISHLAEDLAAQRPTVLIAVPRVFERVLARIEQALARSPVKHLLFHLAADSGWRRFRGQETLFDRLVGRRLQPTVAAPILARLGGRLRVAVVGGAALDKRVAKTFIGLGLPMLQGYGLTETAPVISVNRLEDNDPESVGPPLPNLEVRVNEDHELLVRGPSVMPGYWRNPEASAAVLDADGWLNTGDQAEIRNGLIYIRGRTKDILVLSNGEKVAPEDAEQAILEDPVFEQAMLVGEGRAYVILVAVTRETDERKLVRHANARLKDFPRWMRVRRVIAVQEPWTLEEGLLTPTLKVKRRTVYGRFADRIEKVYREGIRTV